MCNMHNTEKKEIRLSGASVWDEMSYYPQLRCYELRHIDIFIM